MDADLQQALAECGDLVTLNGRQVPAIVPDFSEDTANALFGDDFAIEPVSIIIPAGAACALFTLALPTAQRPGGASRLVVGPVARHTCRAASADLLRASLSIHGTPFVILSVTRHPDGSITLSARKRQASR